MSAPVMPAELAEVELRVIAAARRLERDSQYGISTAEANRQLDEALAEQAVMRLLVAS